MSILCKIGLHDKHPTSTIYSEVWNEVKPIPNSTKQLWVLQQEWVCVGCGKIGYWDVRWNGRRRFKVE